MEHALYAPPGEHPDSDSPDGDPLGCGNGGFFVRERPTAHFRTSVSASGLFAEAVAELLRRVDETLGHPPRLDLVDVGAGRGELLTSVVGVLPASTLRRLRPCGVERVARPAALDPRIRWADWHTWLSGPTGRLSGLLFANEWLDNVPLDVVETGPDGTARYVLVAPDGSEALSEEPLAEADAAWLRRWWPLTGQVGERAEIGRPRDAAWAAAVAAVGRGVAVAVDYGHRREHRPLIGTLTGYRDGRVVLPRPDGESDLTAHVALDACATGPHAELLSQRDALGHLGVSGERPPLRWASEDPAGYLRALSRAGEAAELTDRGGLGGFDWLVEPVGVASPWDGPARPPAWVAAPPARGR